MSFVHKNNLIEDTIAAIATPIGDGAIAIVRISGKEAFKIANSIFSRDVFALKSHFAAYGKILNKNKETVDHVLLIPMKGPKSYTGEDSVEIHCHGGRFITKAVLDVVLNEGARAADPGEFSLRAFRNGKMDLSQAEAVQSLIAAKSKQSYFAAKNQLEGMLSKKIKHFQESLIDIAAILEAWVDFPEEDLEFEAFDSVISRIDIILSKMKELAKTFHHGKKIHEGISICLIGAPNVGKSSLMNLLLRKERAIVSEIEGTTRDTIEEDCLIDDFQIKLVDTAGIRDTDELIEKEGIKRSIEASKKADVIFYLLDATKKISDKDIETIKSLEEEKTIVIQNKCDLKNPIKLDFPAVVNISVLKEEKINELIDVLKEKLKNKDLDNSNVVLTQYRHKNALEKSIKLLENVTSGLRNKTSAEFVSFDMRDALKELGTIIGMDVTEDILSAIFSKFCLGK